MKNSGCFSFKGEKMNVSCKFVHPYVRYVDLLFMILYMGSLCAFCLLKKKLASLCSQYKLLFDFVP